jgi:hypothetical protein
MPVRTWALAAILLLASVLAGCTNADDGAGDGTPTPGPGNGGGDGATAPPADFLIEDAGAITGPFDETWDVVVANVAYDSASIHFELAGLQAGAPPTARVNLELADPDGSVVKSATLGVGGSGNAVTWELTPADTPTAGTYTLRAVAGSDAPLPSAGFATWALHAQVTY